MSKILAPIDSSNLSELIPEGDDIKFSTQCDVRARQGTTIGSTIAKWKSFVLATASGIALQNRLELNQYKDKHLRYKVRKKKWDWLQNSYLGKNLEQILIKVLHLEEIGSYS